MANDHNSPGADPLIPAALSALQARDRIADGSLGAAAYVDACLKQTQAREAEIGAWTRLDEPAALAQAEKLDQYRQTGRALGPLHGLPVGIKDIIDTRDMPTENGNPLATGRQPQQDAWLVQRLRAAGAVIPGKTVSTEFAYLAPGKTRNPHNPEHTPGGSSSGSAAAVACHMLPLAVGTQTGGSVIRPASYCGVVGFKPSFGLIPRSGVLRTSRHLDTVGTFARSIEDTALLADVLIGHDPADPDSRNMASPRLLETALSRPPVPPQLAFIRGPAWGDIEADYAEGLAELCDALGERCDEVELPAVFDQAATAHRQIMMAEIAHNLGPWLDRGGDQLAEVTRLAIEEGRGISAGSYLAALDWREVFYAGLEEIFSRYDAIVTPAVPGEAPRGQASTGSAAFNLLWSLVGVPAITLPLLTGANGLPIGVQLIGERYNDGRLLRTSRWLVDTVSATE